MGQVINVRGSVVPVMITKKVKHNLSDTGINLRIVIMELILNDEKMVACSNAESVW